MRRISNIHTRRAALGLGLSALGLPLLPRRAGASEAREIIWDDLIPPGVPYSEIIGEGEIDMVNDTWNPIFDENGEKLNEALNGVHIKMPGYITPLEFDATSVTQFLLVPYQGACMHVPPPPPNQIVFVNAREPWPAEKMWDAIWVTGILRTQIQTTDLASVGYALEAETMTLYEWDDQ